MRTDESKRIGKRIKRLREFRGIKQIDMAKRLNMEPSAYSRLESGETKLDLERAKELGRELEVPPDYFTNDDPVVVHVEHISGGTNVNARVEQQFPEEFLQRLTDRYEAQLKEYLQQMNARLLELLEKKLG